MSSIANTGDAVRLSDQTLFIDADDTLWENNIYFERAIASFISYLDHRVHSPDEVREHLNRCERATIAAHGYGLQSFRKSLVQCFEELSDTPVTFEHHSSILSFAQAIAVAEIELLPDVRQTLTDLVQRHRLILVTKGNLDEQMDKLDRSGLRPVFEEVEVLAEKNAGSYTNIILRHSCDPSSTWMIGNSPKSDINPALKAGLNAVFIPHDQTWVLEHEVVDQPTPDRQLLELPRFVDLLQYF
jgi:putative hydrolase of the HAD superfamily